MRSGDHTRFGSDVEVIANLNDMMRRLNRAASDFLPESKQDYVGFALQRLTKYVSGQLERLVSLYDHSIEVHAWVARNLFESFLLFKYLMDDRSRAKDFVAQKATDELQINEGLLSLLNPGEDPAMGQAIRDRIDHIRGTLQKHGLQKSGHWLVKTLADQTCNRDEYEAFYKLYSKYVHPSSWLINGEAEEFDTGVIRNIFFLQAQYCAARILKLAEDHLVKCRTDR